MFWSLAGVLGALPLVSQAQATHKKHPDVEYELSVRFGTDDDQDERVAYGSPDHVIHCAFHDDSSAEDASAFEKAKKRNFRDEFGSATAGNDGGGGSERRGLEEEQKEVEFPAEGALFLDYRRELGEGVDKDKRTASLEFPTYNIQSLLAMSAGTSGIASMRSQMDDRNGAVTVFARVTRLARGEGGAAYLRLDAIDCHFGEGYWEKKTSLTRKMRVATSGSLAKAEGSSVHHALDGDLDTAFHSAAPLRRGDSLLVDLQMVYQLSSAKLIEEQGFACEHCTIDVSCDASTWFSVHTFQPGEDEHVVWHRSGSKAAPLEPQGDSADDGEDAEQAEKPAFESPLLGKAPVLARFVRIMVRHATPCCRPSPHISAPPLTFSIRSSAPNLESRKRCGATDGTTAARVAQATRDTLSMTTAPGEVRRLPSIFVPGSPHVYPYHQVVAPLIRTSITTC